MREWSKMAAVDEREAQAWVSGRRLVVLIVVVAASAAPVAAAHPATGFDACVTVRGASGEGCRNEVEAGRGTNLVFKAVVQPSHDRKVARGWLLRPHSRSWEKVTLVDARDGRMRWRWVPRKGDIYNYTPWRFRFVIPGHGSSDTVKVRVRSEEF